MKPKSKSILIHSTPEKVFQQMDDFSKTGMHMTENSMMMMGSKLKLEQLSPNASGVGAKYRWYGKIMGMKMDFSETVAKWQPPKLKEWETVGWCLNNMLNDTKKFIERKKSDQVFLFEFIK